MSGAVTRLVPKLVFSPQAAEALLSRPRLERRRIRRAIERGAPMLFRQYRTARNRLDPEIQSELPNIRVLFSFGDYIGLLNFLDFVIKVDLIFRRDQQHRIPALQFLFYIWRRTRSKETKRVIEISFKSAEDLSVALLRVYFFRRDRSRSAIVKLPNSPWTSGTATLG